MAVERCPMDALSKLKEELAFLEKHMIRLESAPELTTFDAHGAGERAKQLINHLRQEIRGLEENK